MAIARGIRRLGWVGLITFLALAGLAGAAEKDDWIGREFMPKATCTPKVLNQVIPLESLSLPLNVQKVNGNWLWVGRAWVKKCDVVALDDAEAYYDAYLDKHPDSNWGYDCILAAVRAQIAAAVELDMKRMHQEIDAQMREQHPEWKGRAEINRIEESDTSTNAQTVPIKEDWIGREFMPKATCRPKVLNQAFPLKELPLPFNVSKVDGDWLWVGRAWVRKRDVVALDDATTYYFKYQCRHPESKWAEDCNEIAWGARLAASEREDREFDAEMRQFDAEMRELVPDWKGLDAATALDGTTSGDDANNVIEEFEIAKTFDLLIVPVTLDGQEYLFIVDTGCTACIFDSSLRAQMHNTGRTRLMNDKQADVYELPEFWLGEMRMPAGTEASSHDLTWFRLVTGRDIRGILGMNVLKAHILRIDFDAGKLTVLKHCARESTDVEFVLSYSSRGTPTIKTALFTGETRSFIIDLGMTDDGQIERQTFDELLKNGGLAGVTTSFNLTLDGLKFGRMAAVRNSRDGGSRHKPLKIIDGKSNMIGLGALSRYDITFDFPNDRMYVHKGKRGDDSEPAMDPALALEYDKEMADCHAAVRLKPESADAYVARASLWVKRKHYDQALADYGEAIRVDPKSAQSFGGRGALRHTLGNYDEAIRDYDEAIRLDAKFTRAYYNRGGSWLEKGEYNKAIADWNETICLEPTDAAPYYNRGVAWLLQGDYTKAIADWNEAMRVGPTNVSSRAALAWVHATCPNDQFRDGRRAVELATAICESSGWCDGAKLDTLAAAYAETTDFENAVKWQDRAVKFAPEKSKRFYRSRLALYKSGKPYREEPKR